MYFARRGVRMRLVLPAEESDESRVGRSTGSLGSVGGGIGSGSGSAENLQRGKSTKSLFAHFTDRRHYRIIIDRLDEEERDGANRVLGQGQGQETNQADLSSLGGGFHGPHGAGNDGSSEYLYNGPEEIERPSPSTVTSYGYGDRQRDLPSANEQSRLYQEEVAAGIPSSPEQQQHETMSHPSQRSEAVELPAQEIPSSTRSSEWRERASERDNEDNDYPDNDGFSFMQTPIDAIGGGRWELPTASTPRYELPAPTVEGAHGDGDGTDNVTDEEARRKMSELSLPPNLKVSELP